MARKMDSVQRNHSSIPPMPTPLHHRTTPLPEAEPRSLFTRLVAAALVLTVLSCPLSGRAEEPKTLSAREVLGPTPLLALENEPPARLIVDPPLPEPLALGRVFIQYRAENLRLLPVYGKGALDVSPRLGHVHVTVDDAPWHFVDSSGGTLILVGLPPGPHKVLIELADPTHKVITGQTVNFTVPVSHPGSH